MQQILTILGSVGFNWHVALANFVNFLIILFLLNKYFFGKIGRVIEEREAKIKEGVSKGEMADALLLSAEAKKEEIIKHGALESERIIKDAIREADSAVKRRKEEGELELAKKFDDLRAKEQSLQHDVEKSFAQKAPALIAKLYAVTLAKEMTEEENNALIERTIGHMST